MATSPPPTSTGSSKLDAAKANVAAAIDPTAPTGLALYSRFAFAGAVCCSVTHGALTPVDVYVCRLVLAIVCANGLLRAILAMRNSYSR
jgi:solute carrier family 25 phosphate transporter 3